MFPDLAMQSRQNSSMFTHIHFLHVHEEKSNQLIIYRSHGNCLLYDKRTTVKQMKQKQNI